MSSIRDIQNTSETSQGHIQKYIDKKEYIDSFRSRPDAFALLAISQKLEKLSMAVLLVTDLFAPHPLADRLVEVMIGAHGSSFKIAGSTSLEERSLLDLRLLLLEATSLIRSAFVAGYVGQMNTDILVRECDSVQSEISRLIAQAGRQESSIAKSLETEFVALPENLFEVPLFDELRFRKSGFQKSYEPIKPTPLVNDIQRQSTFSSVSERTPIVAEKKTLEKNPIQPQQTPSRTSETVSQKPASDRLHRREEVLKAIRYNGPCESSVLQSLLPNISPKTLQRELQVLLDEHLIIRTGIKRWSVYQLAS